MEALIILGSIAIIAIIVLAGKKENQRQERIAKAKEQLAERAIKEKEERNSIIKERISRLGTLTKTIDYRYKEQIQVYSESQTIVILDKEYKFSDILSCELGSTTIRGTETYVTVPDKYEMAKEQFLWGMGQKYNVKSTTHVIKSPDCTINKVYITVNSITDPIIILIPSDRNKAMEIQSLINVIIKNNQENKHIN